MLTNGETAVLASVAVVAVGAISYLGARAGTKSTERAAEKDRALRRKEQAYRDYLAVMWRQAAWCQEDAVLAEFIPVSPPSVSEIELSRVISTLNTVGSTAVVDATRLQQRLFVAIEQKARLVDHLRDLDPDESRTARMEEITESIRRDVGAMETAGDEVINLIRSEIGTD